MEGMIIAAAVAIVVGVVLGYWLATRRYEEDNRYHRRCVDLGSSVIRTSRVFESAVDDLLKAVDQERKARVERKGPNAIMEAQETLNARRGELMRHVIDLSVNIQEYDRGCNANT